MRFFLRFRSSSAAWGALFAIPLTLFYYFVTVSRLIDDDLHYAPTAVSYALTPMYAFAYAVASCLGAWESGRLESGGVWALAPARSRYRVAADVLLPVACISSLMVVLPAVLALVESGAVPTIGSLGPLALAVILCCAHAVIGFGVGKVVPRSIAAPILAVAVWILVAFSRSILPYWPRHISGQFSSRLMFGEEATLASLLPHLLFTGGIGVAVAALWLPLRHGLVRVPLAAVTAIASMVGATNIVSDWDHDPPLAIGRGAMRCTGSAPVVCMPEEKSTRLNAVHRAAVSVLSDFKAAGVDRSPTKITDSINNGRFTVRSTPEVWQLRLSSAAASGRVRYLLTGAAISWPCSRPDPVIAGAVSAWAAKTTGEETAWRHQNGQERDPASQAARIRTASKNLLDAALAKPAPEQARWFEQSRIQACRKGA
ncbi:hypothetical protein FCH28_24495 [Streptomyces piniterrae]|uniref:DUF7224 domain-containing protein n=1 Tax=Streptomyces piniterrae TaxID=2571125 RepID=A0A4U0N6Q9_9ACTN|nr:hypothetical protein [Streptomyces piniterrae]TJZ49471.1 hypothetical protein FCH28_24495 [Streptomyces piniterrae]